MLSEAVSAGWFRRHEEPDLSCIIRTAKEVAGAMAYLHSMDMLHGDLTGSNILLCASDVDERGFVAKVGVITDCTDMQVDPWGEGEEP